MTSFRPALRSRIALILVILSQSVSVHAGSDTWKLGINGNWETGGNWTDGTTPGNGDTATLGFASSYTVTFGAAPAAIQNLTVTNGGTVTFTSTGGTRTLNVTVAASPDDLNLGTNTTLNLGTASAAFNLNLGSDITNLAGSTLNVFNGSHLTAADLSPNGLAGQLVVNGAGSLLTLTGSGEHYVGGTSGFGSIVLQNGASSASITGTLGLGDAATASTGSVALNGNGTITLSGDLRLATQNVVGSSGSLSVSGATTSVTQTGGGTVIVGSLNNGAASMMIAGSTSATFTTGTGGLGIRPTGSIVVGGGPTVGAFNVNGDVFINGGGPGTGLTVNANSTFTLANGKSMNLQTGGLATFNAEYAAPANATYNIDGTGSKLQVTNNDFLLGNGSAANVTNGGTLSGQYLSVGTNGNGTLLVDGATSTAIGTSTFSSFGLSHSTAIVTFSNGGTGSFPNGLGLADSLFGDTSANVTVKTGGHLNAGTLSLANSSANQESPSATLTVKDANSTLTISPSGTLQLSGTYIAGFATLNIQDNGVVTVGTGGSTLMYPGAVMNINGGYADLKTLNYSGGTINFSAGSLSYIGNLEVGVGGILGADVSLDASKVLTLSGTTIVDPFHTLALTGGILNTGSLSVVGTFSFNSGTLGITGASGLNIGSGGPFGSAFSLQSGRTLNVTNQTSVSSGAVLSIETGAGFTTGSLSVSGELDLNGATATANVGTLNNTGLIRGDGRIVGSGGANALANKSGGEIRAEAGKRLQFIGNNAANAGQINLQGGTAEFASSLTNAAGGQIVGRGTLKVGGAGMVNQGSIALASGITDVFGDVNNNTASGSLGISVSGNAQVNFWDDVTNTSGLFKVNSGSTATFFGTFSGNGIAGNANDIHFEADISPGFSPASITVGGNVSLGAAAWLKIELGGTTPGTQFDQLHVTGNLSLGGALQISLINGFHPSAGNIFDILDWATLSGTFSAVQLPGLATPLGWDTTQLYTTGILSLTATLHGDWNRDGQVTAADVPAMLSGLTDLSTYSLTNALTPLQLAAIGDFDSSGTVTNGDMQGLLDLVAAQGGGSVAVVPEPSTIILLALSMGLVYASPAYRLRYRRAEGRRRHRQNEIGG